MAFTTAYWPDRLTKSCSMLAEQQQTNPISLQKSCFKGKLVRSILTSNTERSKQILLILEIDSETKESFSSPRARCSDSSFCFDLSVCLSLSVCVGDASHSQVQTRKGRLSKESFRKKTIFMTLIQFEMELRKLTWNIQAKTFLCS